MVLRALAFSAAAALLVACVSADVDGVARAYLLAGDVPADGQLDSDAIEAVCERLSAEVAAGAVAPVAAMSAADRAAALGFDVAASALLNNIALQCGEIYGGSGDCDRKDVYRRAHEASPGFVGVALNYAYFLEQRDDVGGAATVLNATIRSTTRDAAGATLFAAALCAPHARDASEVAGRYARLLRRLEALAVAWTAAPPRPEGLGPAGGGLVGNMPIAWPYLGYPVLPLMARLARLYDLADPGGAGVAEHVMFARDEGARPRVAVVAEFGGNTSPGLLFEDVFTGLKERHGDKITLILVAPAGLDTDFIVAAVEAADEVVAIDPSDSMASAQIVADAKADVLCYLAIGLSHITYAMARSRLARVQVVFGHGHPITSGLADTVDYFVSSDLFETVRHEFNTIGDVIKGDEGHAAVTEASVLADLWAPDAESDGNFLGDRSPWARDAAAADAAARGAAGLADDRAAADRAAFRLEAAAASSADGAQAYSEQFVRFDSATIGFRRPPAPPNWTRRALGLPDDPAIFACLQHSKKLHPDFDEALAAVLRSTPYDTKILLLEGARTHLPRFRRTLPEGAADGQLIFLPRMPRERLLAIVKNCDGVLDTYPWGGGVTILEALAVNTPVIVLPAKTTVLNLALGHLRRAGLDDQLVASSVEEYASIAGRLAYEPSFRMLMRLTIEQRSRLLFDDDHRAVDEWARFLVHVATGFDDKRLIPHKWPWAKSRHLHDEETARNREKFGW